MQNLIFYESNQKNKIKMLHKSLEITKVILVLIYD